MGAIPRFYLYSSKWDVDSHVDGLSMFFLQCFFRISSLFFAPVAVSQFENDHHVRVMWSCGWKTLSSLVTPRFTLDHLVTVGNMDTCRAPSSSLYSPGRWLILHSLLHPMIPLLFPYYIYTLFSIIFYCIVLYCIVSYVLLYCSKLKYNIVD